MCECDKEQDQLEKSYATLREREVLMKFDELFYKLMLVCNELEQHPSTALKTAYRYSANLFRNELKKCKQEIDQIRYVRVK